MNLHIVALFRFKENHLFDAIELLKKLVIETRKEEGCLAYTLYESLEERNTFMMVENWQDQLAIENHNQSPLLQKFVHKIADYSTKAPDLKIFDFKA